MSSLPPGPGDPSPARLDDAPTAPSTPLPAGPDAVAPAGAVAPGIPIAPSDDAEPIVPPGAARRGRRRRGRRILVEWLIVLCIAATVAILLRAFVVQAFYVPSPSMEPTLQVGDRILVVKTSLLTGPVSRGSIIVFHRPANFPCAAGDDNIEDLVKRVIGLPGETIWSVGNTIYIDGKALSDPGWYRAGYPQVGSTPITRQTIPKDDYFVMGDNRTDSCDSRSFGPISASSVVGQVELIVWRDGHPYVHAF